VCRPPVLLTPDLVLLTDAAAHPAGACTPLTDGDFAGNAIANAGELPGLLAAAWLLERLGRRATVRWSLRVHAARWNGSSAAQAGA
jgi:hypothetical protein